MKKITTTIRHYVRVYRMIMVLNWKKLLTYRADLINSAIAHSIWATFTLFQMLLLTSKASSVFGWSRNELLILAGMYNIIYSFFYLFFSRGFNQFSNTIHFGRLDGILTKPIDSQFIMTCLYVSYTQIIRFVLGLGFLIYILSYMHLVITPFLILKVVFLSLFSLTIIYSFWMIVMTLVIWFPKLSNLTDLLYQTNQVGKFPQEIYKGASTYLLFVLFPLTIIIVTPAKQLMQKIQMNDVLLLLFIASSLFIVSRLFWRYALRFYTSVSG